MRILEIWFENILQISLFVSVVIVALGIARRSLGERYGVKWRHYIWIALALRLIIPTYVALPQPMVTLPSVKEGVAAVERVLPERRQTQPTPLPIEVTSDSMTLPSAEPTVPQKATAMSFFEYPWIFWLGGAGLFLGWQMGRYLLFCRMLKRNRRRVLDANALDVYYRLCRSVENRPALYFCEGLTSPLCKGFFHKEIYINQEDIPSAQLTMILKHELMHIRRQDVYYKGLLLLVQGIYFFNPFVHWMVKMAEEDMEYACDAEVMQDASLEERKAYGMTILDTIRQGQRGTMLSTSFHGGKKALKVRLEHIFDTRLKKRGIALLLAVAVLLSCGGIFVGCSQEEAKPQEAVQGEEEPYSDEVIRALYDAKVDYIGNAPGVGTILGLLPLPAGMEPHEDGMELFTTEEPFGALRHIQITDMETVLTIGEDEIPYFTTGDWFPVHAIIFLSLVDNADYLKYAFHENGIEASYRFSRETAKQYYGDKDLREFSADYETFSAFVKELLQIVQASNEPDIHEEQSQAAMVLVGELAMELEEGFTYAQLAAMPKYEELLKMGNAALSTMLLQFQGGWGNDKAGYVMMLACNEIMRWPQDGLEFLAEETLPTDWFQLYLSLDSVALSAFTYDAITAKEGKLLPLEKAAQEGLVTRRSERQKAIYDALDERFNADTNSRQVDIYAPLICEIKETGKDSFSLYGIMGETEYTLFRIAGEGYGLHDSSGSHNTARIDFVKENGKWRVEKWIDAEDGSFHAPSILEMCDGDQVLADKMIHYDHRQMSLLLLQNLIFYLGEGYDGTVYSPSHMDQGDLDAVNEFISYDVTYE